jgi:hypothetical protein
MTSEVEANMHTLLLFVAGLLAAAAPGPVHRRDILLSLFWPDLNAARGRAALSRAVHYLRTSLGGDGNAVVSYTMSNSRGTITVCGLVAGRNGSGAYVGMAPYVGVMMGTRASPDIGAPLTGADAAQLLERIDELTDVEIERHLSVLEPHGQA